MLPHQALTSKACVSFLKVKLIRNLPKQKKMGILSHSS